MVLFIFIFFFYNFYAFLNLLYVFLESKKNGIIVLNESAYKEVRNVTH